MAHCSFGAADLLHDFCLQHHLLIEGWQHDATRLCVISITLVNGGTSNYTSLKSRSPYLCVTLFCLLFCFDMNLFKWTKIFTIQYWLCILTDIKSYLYKQVLTKDVKWHCVQGHVNLIWKLLKTHIWRENLEFFIEFPAILSFLNKMKEGGLISNRTCTNVHIAELW